MAISSIGRWLTKCCLISAVLTGLANAAQTDEIDELTRQWLQIEQQNRKLTLQWQEKKPVLQQRIALLTAEKKQLEKMLTKTNASQDEVESRRKDLLAEQNALEAQQEQVDASLSGLTNRVNAMYEALPPLLKRKWEKEELALEDSTDSSKRLQVTLAKLSQLAQFDGKITVNEAVLTAPDGKDVLVKQLYLGSHLAWFANKNGEYAGIGKVVDDQWQWNFDNTIDTDAINQALAIYERRQQPGFVSLPFDISETGAGQ